jgi:transcriptional regulator GlxA family with amidase domain
MIQVGLYLFDDVEVLDFAGPFEVLSTASRIIARRSPEIAGTFRIATIGETTRPILARGGLSVNPQFTLEDHPPIDLLIVPGGIVEAELANPHLMDWLQKVHSQTQITASVCTGSFLLANAGLLDGLAATTHWEDIDDMAERFPKVDVQSAGEWIDTGRIVTAAGISAGIEMSFHLVSRLLGNDWVALTARQMEYTLRRPLDSYGDAR